MSEECIAILGILGVFLQFQRDGASAVTVEGMRVARKCLWSDMRRMVKEEMNSDWAVVSTGSYLGKTTFSAILEADDDGLRGFFDV